MGCAVSVVPNESEGRPEQQTTVVNSYMTSDYSFKVSETIKIYDLSIARIMSSWNIILSGVKSI